MPSKLRKLRVTRVDLVDRGAQPDADVLLFKRDDTPSEELIAKRIRHENGEYCVRAESGRSMGCYKTKGEAIERLRQVEAHKRDDGDEETLFQRLLGRLTSALGVEKADERPAPTYGAELMERKSYEIMSDLGDYVGALHGTLMGVLHSDAADKLARMQGALQDFAASAGSALERWLTEAGIAKAGRKISAERLGRLKQVMATIQGIIAEAEPEETDPLAKGKEERMSEEQAAILKRLEDLEAQVKEGEEVKKRLATAEAELLVTKTQATESAELAKRERDLRLTTEFVGVCKRFTHLGMNPDDDAPVMKRLSEVDPDGWAWVEKKLSAANEQLKLSGKITKVLGSDRPAEPVTGRGEDGSTGAEAEVLAKAKAVVAKGAGTSLQDAISHVLNEDPELYRRYRKEAARKSRGDDEDDGE